MNVGMMWIDDDQKRTLEEKVRRAVAYYREKYGRKPTLCWVHPTAVADETMIAAVTVRPAVHIRPQHFWIGVSQKAQGAGSAT